MITTWLKMWADQASSRSERRQRLALIAETFPFERNLAFRHTGRRAARSSRARHALCEEVAS